jgi:cysteine sulfinate desulfinase/cysteine desulfurase-like protein
MRTRLTSFRAEIADDEEAEVEMATSETASGVSESLHDAGSKISEAAHKAKEEVASLASSAASSVSSAASSVSSLVSGSSSSEPEHKARSAGPAIKPYSEHETQVSPLDNQETLC